jgi:hypothetical protein
MESVRGYVLGLNLPTARSILEAAPPVQFSEEKEAVAVGAQLAEFAKSVLPELRSAISNSMLLAQLAANKAADQSEDVFAWYHKYIEVLQNIGWEVKDLDFQARSFDGAATTMHKALIPVITTMLGPEVAAASIVISALNALKDTDTAQPWITLFDRTARHASGAKLQISYVNADELGEPTITLICVGVVADRTITQVLFFKFSDQSADVKKASGKFSLSSERLMDNRDVISSRVQPFITEYIKKIDI